MSLFIQALSPHLSETADVNRLFLFVDTIYIIYYYYCSMTEDEYVKLRQKCIDAFSRIYKNALAFDLCEVPKDIRIRLMEDDIYVNKTKAIKASLFEDQLTSLDEILAGRYTLDDKDPSATILKALEMKNKLLLEDLNIQKDESKALNITFVAFTKEDFEAMAKEEDATVVLEKGSNNNTQLGVDFGISEDNDSFEARMKADAQERLKQLEK